MKLTVPMMLTGWSILTTQGELLGPPSGWAPRKLHYLHHLSVKGFRGVVYFRRLGGTTGELIYFRTFRTDVPARLPVELG